ncbi:choline/ethanolamine kinase-like isoform X2 [Diadema antillarum]|uniref:choline/ethanolamine kinase-like isoform X2 n=1 Tax=Diadema antillarum TaxID=105358 RepID=UPI003A8C697B
MLRHSLKISFACRRTPSLPIFSLTSVPYSVVNDSTRRLRHDGCSSSKFVTLSSSFKSNFRSICSTTAVRHCKSDKILDKMDGAVDNETKLKAYTWCQEYLGGVWKQIDLEDFQIKDLRAGLSNYLYLCSLPAHQRGTCNGGPQEVLLRVYGEIFFEGETPLLDTVIFSLLSERRQAPKLYGVFREGRLEEYIPSRALRTEELSDPQLSQIIANKLACFHQLQLPLCKVPRWLDQMLDKWFNKAMSVSFEDDARQQLLKEILSHDLEMEKRFVKKLISETKSPVVFSHNDCQEGNILLVNEDNSNKKNLILIDYEYSSYNYREFDIANHFCEWAQNYCKEEPPYFELKSEDFPTRGQQLTFIKAYLAASQKMGMYQPSCHGDTAEEEEAILREVKRFSPVSHFLWVLWSIVQAKISQTTFGYMEYAVARFNEYLHHKSMIPLDMLPSLPPPPASLDTPSASFQQPVDSRQSILT